MTDEVTASVQAIVRAAIVKLNAREYREERAKDFLATGVDIFAIPEAQIVERTNNLVHALGITFEITPLREETTDPYNAPRGRR